MGNMHTKHAGIVATWTQGLNKDKYLRVFIWNSKKSMWRAFDRDKTLARRHDYVGRCNTFPQATGKKGRKSGRKFAEIHLVAGKFGSGVVAH